ncbi:alkaline phosphatase PhoX [Nocardioides sp.]|uniref:alkaline phosphatase PhoX n=1 Tax=Nocardioides sp. TaxID=35761 RepID=UPI003526F37D
MRSTTQAMAVAATAVFILGATGGPVTAGPGHGRGFDPGPVLTDPDGVIDLPAGYSYDVLVRDCVDQVTSTESGATFAMPSDFDSNQLVRGAHGQVQLLTAHELTKPVPGDYQGDAGKCAVPEQATTDDGDSDGWGSVSRLTLGRDGTTVKRSELIATGLHNLCAGVLTPRGTFLVNEEFPFLDDPEQRSGWVWEIDPKTGAATKLTGMGRMSHEQEVRSHGAWYLTDDRGNFQFLYKFVPDRQRDLTTGQLYGLNFDRATNTGSWVPIDDPANAEAEMAAKVGVPDATNSFWKHEGIIKAKHGNGVVFSESASSSDPGRVWHLRDTRHGVVASVLLEGDFAKLSRPDNLRYDRAGNLYVFEDNGSALANSDTGGNNEVYVLPKGTLGSDSLVKLATVRDGGEGTGPIFSRNGKLLYLSIQDQEQPDGSDGRVIAIHLPGSHH